MINYSSKRRIPKPASNRGTGRDFGPLPFAYVLGVWFLALVALGAMLGTALGRGAALPTSAGAIAGAGVAFWYFQRVLGLRGALLQLGCASSAASILAERLRLDKQRFEVLPVSEAQWAAIAVSCAAAMRGVRTLCSLTTIRNPGCPRLAERDFVETAWRADFAAPERVHVLQDHSDGELGQLLDEWITIGDRTFQNAGSTWFAWAETPDIEFARSLTARTLTRIVEQKAPMAVETRRQAHGTYVVARYRPVEAKSVVAGLRQLPGSGEGQQLEIWIDRRSRRIVRACMPSGTGTGARVISQAFACFNEPIRIRRPLPPDAEPASKVLARLTGTGAAFFDFHP